MIMPRIPNDSAIDINCCFNAGTTNDRMLSYGVRTDLPSLLAEYERMNIIASAHSTYAAARGGTFLLEENRCLYDRIHKESSLFQWVVVDPEDPSLLLQAETMLRSSRVLGIRLPDSTRHRGMGAYADALFALAEENGAAVMVQPTHALEIRPFAEKYSSVHVIVPQLCMERLDKECFAEHIAGLPNVYTDTSGNPSTLNRSLEYVVETCGADHVLFASGGASLAFEKARVLLSALSREDQQKILLHNALRVFPKLDALWKGREEVAQ